MIIEVIFIVSCIWILFFGGASKIENSFLGYFTLGAMVTKNHSLKV